MHCIYVIKKIKAKYGRFDCFAAGCFVISKFRGPNKTQSFDGLQNVLDLAGFSEFCSFSKARVGIYFRQKYLVR